MHQLSHRLINDIISQKHNIQSYKYVWIHNKAITEISIIPRLTQQRSSSSRTLGLLPLSPSFQTFSNVRKRLVLALLQPAIPRLESFRLLDLEGAGDVVLNVVIGEVLAAFVADASGVSSGAPFHTADLEDPETVAGRCLRSGNQAGVQTALALHQANPIAN